MSVNLGTIGNFFKSLGSKVHNALLHIFGQQALDQVEAQIKQILSDDIRVIFLDAIQAAQTLQVGVGEASGPEKRIAAFNKISTDLKTKGVSLGEAAINLGIELCVNLLKAKQPA